jgi:hypothetical protein
MVNHEKGREGKFPDKGITYGKSIGFGIQGDL